MLKKAITYTDFNGQERTEDFYFNLTEAELTDLEIKYNGGLSQQIKELSVTTDKKKIIDIFKDIILNAYGKKSPDGRVFLKNDQIREEFACTNAYNELFMSMVRDENAADFITALIPKIALPQEKK